MGLGIRHQSLPILTCPCLRLVTRWSFGTLFVIVAVARVVHTMFYVLWLLYDNESRSIMYTFIYSNLKTHGYEDVTIHHQSTSKITITLLNFPYIHSHIQSYSTRVPTWPSPHASCGLDFAVNQTSGGSRGGRLGQLPRAPREGGTKEGRAKVTRICMTKNVIDFFHFK